MSNICWFWNRLCHEKKIIYFVIQHKVYLKEENLVIIFFCTRYKKCIILFYFTITFSMLVFFTLFLLALRYLLVNMLNGHSNIKDQTNPIRKAKPTSPQNAFNIVKSFKYPLVFLDAIIICCICKWTRYMQKDNRDSGNQNGCDKKWLIKPP